jgi:predicted metal-dependent hydrolase
MNFNILLNGFKMNVDFIKSTKIKNIYMKILDDENIQIKSNIYFTIDNAKDLINDKRNWILKHIKKYQYNKLSSKEFFYLGKVYNLKDFNIDILSLDDFYTLKAKNTIHKIVNEYSNKMNLYPNNIKFRKNKTIWGSCSFINNISFNIYLMKLPLNAIIYVVIHELAHIKYKNHSKKFWNLVELFCTEYKVIQNLIKNNHW